MASNARPTGQRSRKRGDSSAMKILYIIVIALIVLVAYQAFVLYSLSGQVVSDHALITALSRQLNGSAKTNATLSLPSYNITSQLVSPPLSLSGYPTVTQNETFGSRLTGINSQLNASELSVINNAPDSYFETAGEMLLNGSIDNEVGIGQPQQVNLFTVNGKPSVIYFGSITCIYCGENRWAMALALGRFGSFGELYKGYSSFGDGDLPTLYWRPDEYSTAAVNIGSFYNSSYINFLPIEDSEPVTQGFDLQSFPAIEQELNSTGNLAYSDALQYILQINSFQGTPYTIWGRYVVNGADAVDLGNSPPTSTPFALTNMTHAQVLSQLASPDDQFAWTEYAAADIYIALACSSINNTAPICGIPVMPELESKLGVGS
ncbi:MAG TPA: DUF929 family protein [Candidatus Acidoferrum sp.]|nr:DUF929 family protein [Candidatus Acidoferrum sp.]